MKNKQGDTLVASYSTWQLVKDIAQYLKPYKWRFIGASIIRLIADLVWLYPPIALASVVTFVSEYHVGESLQPVWVILALWFSSSVVRSFGQFFSKYLGFMVAERVNVDSTLKGAEHMFRLDMRWQEKENSGNKIKRIQNASLGYNTIIRRWFSSLIQIGVSLVAINIILAQFDLTIVGMMAAYLVTYGLLSAKFFSEGGKASFQVNAQEEVLNGSLFESINNIRTMKVMSMGKAMYGMLAKETRELLTRLKKRITIYQSTGSFLSFWSYSFKISMVAIIAYGITHGHYEVGFLVLFNSYFNDLREAIDQLTEASQEFIGSKLSIARMNAILHEPITIEDETGKVALPKDWKKITFKNVSFSYEKHKVLRNVSFEVIRGQKVGIVGLSGAGKSTLFKLLLKEREGFEGEILFDDVPIQKIRASDYFKNASVVLQDTEVFNLPLRDNITITNMSQAKNERLLHRAMQTAHISDFVGKLSDGLDTLIGEKGVKLSGGERQRLGIARAIFKEPKLLLLDEATSHLDLESEEKIKASLHEFLKETTAIVIAHRLTTIKEMDEIFVLEHGRIVESGSFDELYAKKGRFFELWEKQRL